MEGLKGPEQAQQILAKYPVAQLNHTLLAFVANARAAMGPNMLKVDQTMTLLSQHIRVINE